ncbi:MAG: NAD kinase [Lachnoclostridium sp.]|nr:NAD kinase [Lachnoclostridium sp.]
MKIAFIGKRRQTERDIRLINKFMKQLADKGVDIAIELRLLRSLRDAGKIEVNHFTEFDGDAFDADFVISIGGDGTLLRSATTVAMKHIPIVGVNTGHLGFLADEMLDNASAITSQLLAGDYAIEDRAMLEVSLHDNQPGITFPGSPYALNEVAVLRQDTASMISVNARLDGMDVADYQGDGLIISTPTGSTAYNLSVGGPIIEPSAPAFVISPIAPHALTMRPLVVSHHRTIELSVYSRSNSYRLTLDGRAAILPLTTALTVKKAEFPVRIVHFPGSNFFDTLRAKMLWGVSKR